jgi:hypothetical protein
MNGQFIGTANTNELEELQEDSNAGNQNGVNGVSLNDNSENEGAGQHEMLLDDEPDDLLLPQGNNSRDNGNYRRDI